MGKALYRKHRSKSLSEIIGQEHITSVLENSLKSGKISHAYLFTGPRGTGKTSVARILAHAVNDFPYELEDDHLDIIEIDAASNTGVDNIRDLRERALVAPTKGKYKVYIIDEVHMLSKSAFNALLKTLEEPPAHVIFIMATTDAHKVPITITSRSQQFVFRLADPKTMTAHLKKIAEAEKIPIDTAALEIIAKRGGGSFRDSISLLDQISTLTDEKITPAIINKALGLPGDELIKDLLDAYEAGDQPKILGALKSLESAGIKPELLAEELLITIIDNPSPSLLPLLSALPEVPRSPFPKANLLLALLSSTPTTGISTSNGALADNSPRLSTPVVPKSVATESSGPFSNSHPPSPTTTHIPAVPDGFGSPSSGVGAPKDEPEAVPPVHQRMASSAEMGNEKKRPEDSEAGGDSRADRETGEFSWDSMLAKIQEKSLPLHSHLSRLSYTRNGSILTIYARNKFTLGLLEKPANKTLLIKCLCGLTLRLIPETKPPEDESLTKISGILGDIQEVKIDEDVF